jgi:hypothetical protein
MASVQMTHGRACAPRPRSRRIFALLGGLAAASLLASACSNPCDRLLKRLCDCPGERAKQACAEARKRREARDREALDKERCRRELEKFKCAEL